MSSDRQENSGGKTQYASGARTPRKVQWLDDRPGSPSPHTTHSLDERGLDHATFTKLTEALEGHRKVTPLSKVHYYPPPSQNALSSSSLSSESDGAVSDDEDSEVEQMNSYFRPKRSRVITDTTIPSSRIPENPSPTHDVPGNRIEDSEDAGLPGTKDLRKFSRKAAEQLVHRHVRRIKRRPEVPTSVKRSSGGARSSHLGSSRTPEEERDIEKDGQGSSIGGGILSELLGLYHQPGESRDSGWSSNETLTREGLSSDDLLPNRSKPAFQSKGRRGKGKEDRFHTHKPTHKLPSIFGHISRPSAARNAGGVVGSLIASTGNLAGAAAPIQSQLQPNVKRPGYHLSRYSLENETSLPRPPPLARSSSEHSLASNPPWLFDGAVAPTPPQSKGSSSNLYEGGLKSNFSGLFGSSFPSGRRSGASTPRSAYSEKDYASDFSIHSNPRKGPKRHTRKKAEVFITRHVAQIIRREEFLMKLTRALMMFGGPPHRLQAQIQSAARVLDIHVSFLYLPDVVLLSFDDNATGTSHVKLIRQASALDLGKLKDAFSLYWKVIHDRLSVSDASIELDALMQKRPLYKWWQLIIIGGMCSASICTVSFGGSFIDAVISFPLGSLLIALQALAARNILFSYVFEVVVTTLFSFIAAALAATHKFCYPAVASSSVVLILPGFLVLTGSLELMSRNIIPGSVRLCFAVVYALFLGFGFTIGAQLFEIFTSSKVYGAEDYECLLSHPPHGRWYRKTPSKLWAFLTVPMFSLFLSMRNQAPWFRKEMALLISIASAGWVTNYFSGTRFVGQSDITAAVGAFAVGLISNIYARFFSGNAFVVMITGILFQLPSGLGSGGLLSYASQQTSGSVTSYLAGFDTALKLISVAIGLTVGLGLSLVLTHPIQSRKREAGIFSL